MAIIFDLDQTMINSLDAEALRKSRNWTEVYKMIPSLIPFNGIDKVLDIISEKDIPYAIVTSSPRPYCMRIMSHWNWKTPSVVCYHDTSRRKPHPDPILLAIEKMNVSSEYVISIGDDPRDIQASKAAGIKSAGALWGISNTTSLIESQPDIIFATVKDLENYIISTY